MRLKPFVLYSDHESLTMFKNQAVSVERKRLAGGMHSEAIAGYTFEQRYRKGDRMTVPDALSRAFAAFHELSYGRYRCMA